MYLAWSTLNKGYGKKDYWIAEGYTLEECLANVVEKYNDFDEAFSAPEISYIEIEGDDRATSRIYGTYVDLFNKQVTDLLKAAEEEFSNERTYEAYSHLSRGY